MGGQFLLRLEDIDRSRCRPEFADAIREDLNWLGLDWPEPVMVQSDRFDAYADAAARLSAMGLLYPCFCTRQEVSTGAAGADPDGAPLYDGRCRHLSADEAAARLHAGHTAQYRLNTGEAYARTGMLTFTVAMPTPLDRPQIRHARPERWGDVVLVRRDTPASYHLSVVVDDAAQGITHVTRGRDMEAATDIHVLVQMLLGLPQPIYSFHRLIAGEDGKKLSKSKGSPNLRSLRAEGWTAARIRAAVGID